jgi:phosphohistidine swiveling domain-containing protein
MSILELVRKNLKEEFLVARGDGRPIFISGIAPGFTQNSLFRKYSFIISFFKEGQFTWITLKKDQKYIFNKILEKQLSDPNYWEEQLNKYLIKKGRLGKNFFAFNLKTQKLSISKVLDLMQNAVDLQIETRKIDSAADAVYFFITEELRRTLKDYFNNDESENRAFSILTMHENNSFLAMAENDLIKISKRISKKTRLYILSQEKISKEIPEGLKKQLEKYHKKYFWIKTTSFAGVNDYGPVEVYKEFRSIVMDNKKTVDMVKSHAKRLKYIKEKKLNPRIIALSKLSVLFTYWQDLRKENSIMTTYLLDNCLRELSISQGSDLDSLTYLYLPELINLFKAKNVSLSKGINNRKQGVLFVFSQNKFEVYPQNEVADILRVASQTKINTNLKEFKGIPVSKGVAIGRAKILLKIDDIKKIKPGDILIAPMTRPEHLLAMKNAAAFVTDEGGVTCHAAIISRELKKPCIVGTKNATAVLHDGDMVEVDANKGIVKIIK